LHEEKQLQGKCRLLGAEGTVRRVVATSTAGGRRACGALLHMLLTPALCCCLVDVAGGVVNFSVFKYAHLQGMFLSLTSNYLLAFTYLKAIINTWL
jgi:hypothetical protein